MAMPGQTPRKARWATSIRWGLNPTERPGGCPAGSLRRLAGNPGDSRSIKPAQPWRVARGGGTGDMSLPCGTTATAERASRRNRARGQRRKRRAAAAALDGSANWRRGHCAASAAAPCVLLAGQLGSPITTKLPHARPRSACCARGGAADSRDPARTSRAVASPRCRFAVVASARCRPSDDPAGCRERRAAESWILYGAKCRSSRDTSRSAGTGDDRPAQSRRLVDGRRGEGPAEELSVKPLSVNAGPNPGRHSNQPRASPCSIPGNTSPWSMKAPTRSEKKTRS